MKRTGKIISVFLAAIFVFSAMTVMTASAVSYIGKEKAQQIAYADAKVTAEDVIFCDPITLDIENGVVVYDVEFFTAQYEYDYKINATTGAIVKKDFPDPTVRPSQQQGDLIGMEKAKTIACAYYGFSVDEVRFTKTKSDFDDGYRTYEVEFVVDKTEYEVEIDAVTGDIISAETERADTNAFVDFFVRIFEAIRNFFEKLFHL